MIFNLKIKNIKKLDKRFCIDCPSIVRKSGLKYSLYTQYKKKGDQTVRDQFQALRQKIKKKIKTTYNGYLNDLLGLSENNKTCDRKKTLFLFEKLQTRSGRHTSPERK